MNPKIEWVQVRVRRSVHTRLQAFADMIQAQAQTKAGDRLPPFCEGTVSLSDAIALLLWRNDQHAARSKVAGQRRRKRPDKVQS